MIKKHLMIYCILVFAFAGCSSKREGIYVTDNKIYSVALQHTKKVDIVESLETKAIFTVTYLNFINETYDDDNHNFLIGVYVPDKHFRNEKIEYAIIHNGLDLELKNLDENHMMFNNIPLENKWAEYRLTSIPKDGQNSITIELEARGLGNTIVTLQVKN